jgi:enoyl-CoA hydratase/carnithine racemase
MSDDILFTQIGNLGIVTLNRPSALNALTHEMVCALHAQLDAWQIDHEIKAIIVRGTGEKAFCAGGDIRKIYDARSDNSLSIKQFFWDEYRLNQRIFHYPKPYIALLDGITMGGGVGIAIHGTYRVATERFIFAMPETSIGFFPDVGGSYFLPRCKNEIGSYLGLSGARLKVADTAYLGLTTHFINAEKIPAFIDELASSNLGGQPEEAIKIIIQKYHQQPEEAPLLAYQKDIQTCFAHTSVEAIIAALQARGNEWCTNLATLLLSKSPTSLKVTLEQLRKGKEQTFDACMQMEYRMVIRFLQSHDFYEGIRAVIVDKDQKPKWQPAELSAVTSAMVNHYFVPLSGTEIAELTFDK